MVDNTSVVANDSRPWVLPQSIKWLSTTTRERRIPLDSESGRIPHLFGTFLSPHIGSCLTGSSWQQQQQQCHGSECTHSDGTVTLFLTWVNGLCWPGTWPTGWERHIYSVYSISNWRTTYAWLCQVCVTSCSHSCLQWRRKWRNTRTSVLMIQPGKLRLWCSECCCTFYSYMTNFDTVCSVETLVDVMTILTILIIIIIIIIIIVLNCSWNCSSFGWWFCQWLQCLQYSIY